MYSPCKKVIFLFIMFMFFASLMPAHAGSRDPQKRKFFPEPHKVFWKGIITVKVDSFTEAREKSIEIAEKYGGKSYSEKIKVNNNGRKSGEIQFRIPVKNRHEFIKEAHNLGVIYSQKISAPDVTEEFVDLGRRLTNLQAEEKQLLMVLKQARHVLEILQVQSHLFNVRVEIERITTRRNEIALKSEDALFTLVMFEPLSINEPVTPGGSKEFFQRWWNYFACPLVKKQVKNTYYVFTGFVMSYTLGLTGSVPNVIIIVAFLLVLLIFRILVWPLLSKNLSLILGELKTRDIPLGKFIWTVIFLYFFNFLFPKYSTILFLILLYLWWLWLCDTETIKNMFLYFEKKGIKSASIHVSTALLLFISIFYLLFPAIIYGIKDIINTILLYVIIISIPAGIIIIIFAKLLSDKQIQSLLGRFRKKTEEKEDKKPEKYEEVHVEKSEEIIEENQEKS